MANEFHILGRLAETTIGSRLFRDWVGSGLRVPGTATGLSATGELGRALAGVRESNSPEGEAAPLFLSPWKTQWDKGLSGLLQGRPDVSGYPQIGRRLAAGECDVVVTGQQPGLLGGPLYTLFKVATTVALARRRTTEGRPTVPVYWSGDDDDDLAEALGPVYWGPGDRALRRSNSVDPVLMKNRRFLPVGDFPARSAGSEAGRWLTEIAAVAGSGRSGGNALAKDLAQFWSTAEAANWTWSEWQQRALMRIFSGCGLVIVSGNDPVLHEAAAPLYRQLLHQRAELAALAQAQGEKLVAGGWHAQLSPRSLARPVFHLQEGKRVHLDPEAGPVAAGLLRPGVLFRSLVQDWLLRPSAVVVGPGELAYLRQMDPLYEAVGMARSPLVPRQFGWLAPAGFDPAVLMRHGKAAAVSNAALDGLADSAAGAAEEELRRILVESLHLESGRATDLAAGRARRYRKGVAALLSAESARKAADESPSEPVWVFPDGERQERHLAAFCAAALWGDELVVALLHAAEEHLARGGRGEWSEFMIEV